MEPAKQIWDYDKSEVTGESPPINPPAFARAANRHFRDGVRSFESLTPDDHEVVVNINEQTVPIKGLRTRIRRGTEFVANHKTEGVIIAASVLTVAGILAARRSLRVRKKPNL
jgi:hypothetical protein